MELGVFYCSDIDTVSEIFYNAITKLTQCQKS